MDFENILLTDLESGRRKSSNELTRVPAQLFQMRCPNCRKLYSVEPGLLGTDRSHFTKFECVSCKTAFLAMNPEMHGRQFLETKFLETQFAPLASSETESALGSSLGSTEMESKRDLELVVDRSYRSAVVLVPLQDSALQARAAEDIELSESAVLLAMWNSVLDSYLNLARHESFVNRCFEEGRLAFASHKYAQILVADPQNEIARKMRNRVTGFASYGFDAGSRGLETTSWKIPLPSFNSFIILLGTIAAVVGLAFPNAGHTAGLGFAMIALALGLRFFLRRPA